MDEKKRNLPFWKRAFSRRVHEKPPVKPGTMRERDSAVPGIARLPAELLVQIVSLVNPLYLYPLKLAGNHRLLDAVRSQYPVSFEEYVRQTHAEMHQCYRHPNFILGLAAARGQLGLIEALFAVATSGPRLRRPVLGFSRAATQPEDKVTCFLFCYRAHDLLRTISYDTFDESKDALHWAAEFGQDEAVKLLLKLGANPRSAVTMSLDDRVPRACGSAIHLAAANGHESTIRLLLRHGASPTDHRTDALVWAACYGQSHVIKLLAKSARPLFSKRPNLGVALLTAVPTCHAATVQLLLELKAPVNVVSTHNRNTSLHYAAINGSKDVALLLLKHKANVNPKDSDGKTPLDLAMADGYDSVAKVLLEYGSSHEFHDSTLSLAAERGYEECVRLLLEAGATGPGCKPTSQYYSDNQLLEDLFTRDEECYDMCRGIFPALHQAVYASHPSIVNLLLQHGQDVNGGTPRFRTSLKPLHFAALSYHDNNQGIEAAKLLIEAGARVHPSPSTCAGPLYLAAERGKTELIRLLVKHGADPNYGEDGRNRTPLMVAAANQREEAVETLLALGADIDAQDAEGNTALHYAFFFGGQWMYDHLVHHGAAEDVRNNRQKTAAEASAAHYSAPLAYRPLRPRPNITIRRPEVVIPHPFRRTVNPCHFFDRPMSRTEGRITYTGY